MEILQAEKLGVEAFNAGLGRAPARNGAFINSMRGMRTRDMLKVMDAYLHGWDIANLAKDAVLPDMPSVIELARITGTNVQQESSHEHH